MEYKNVLEELPISESIEDSCGTYYLVKLVGYPPTLAMYLKNKEGEENWYTSYTSKICVEVSHWCQIEK